VNAARAARSIFHHLAYPAQVVVELLFREFVDHRGEPATANLA
jgi:hypothetical protein